MPEDANTQLSEQTLHELLFPDFRADRMDTAEGRGIAKARMESFFASVDEDTLIEAYTSSGWSSHPDDMTEEERWWEEQAKDAAAEDALEEADLIGFWVAWHRAGGFSGLESAGWHRTTIFRRLRGFRSRFRRHPDVMTFPWITLDLEKAWAAQIQGALDAARGIEPDLDVNGHRDLPTGGHENSPRTATRIPRGRPWVFPRDGHGNSPRTVMFLPTDGLDQRRHPLP